MKPAVEPAILARKPLGESSIVRNVLKWGTGGLHVDLCRFRPGDVMWPGPQEGKDLRTRENTIGLGSHGIFGHSEPSDSAPHSAGRFPANLIYCPKASRAERELGCDLLPPRSGAEAVKRKEGSKGTQNPRAGAGRTATEVRNFHPTVKPVRLMRWLARLVTPPGETILDPFMGSGTVGVAAMLDGFAYQGAEISEDFHAIATARIRHAREYPISWAHTEPGSRMDADDWVEKVTKAGQLGMFS